jgi:hypothetical protein
MTGFMRTQVLAVAASIRLAEHLQDGGRTAEDFAAFKNGMCLKESRLSASGHFGNGILI